MVGAVCGVHSNRCSARRRPRPGMGGALRAFMAATLLYGVSLAGEVPIKGSAEFFDQYCSECHYEDQSGGLDLSELTFEPGSRENFSTWVRLIDRVTAGEMPPRKAEKRPAPEELAAFTRMVATPLTGFERE